MRRFWDRRAQEDAFFFVDNRLPYQAPDLERFWADGERDLDVLLRTLGAVIEPDDRVLEIGCGVGRLTRVLAARAADVRALDVSSRMLDVAREHNPQLTNVEWILGDGCTLGGIETSSVDVCISHVVFQHIPDPRITLGYVREIGRVLKLDGWAAFQVSNDASVHTRQPVSARLRGAVRAVFGGGPRGQHDRRWLGSMVELDDLRRVSAEASMEIERLVGEGSQYCCVLARRVTGMPA